MRLFTEAVFENFRRIFFRFFLKVKIRKPLATGLVVLVCKVSFRACRATPCNDPERAV
jgi:hypothetical protein